MGDHKDARDIDQEWKNRVLCSDESCIGTIGADGCCRECGRVFEGDFPVDFHDTRGRRESAPMVGEDNEEAPGPSDRVDAIPDDGMSSDLDPDDAWERRTLCIDEGCIGVVDEQSGCCKECGKSYPIR